MRGPQEAPHNEKNPARTHKARTGQRRLPAPSNGLPGSRRGGDLRDVVLEVGAALAPPQVSGDPDRYGMGLAFAHGALIGAPGPRLERIL